MKKIASLAALLFTSAFAGHATAGVAITATINRADGQPPVVAPVSGVSTSILQPLDLSEPIPTGISMKKPLLLSSSIGAGLVYAVALDGVAGGALSSVEIEHAKQVPGRELQDYIGFERIMFGKTQRPKVRIKRPAGSDDWQVWGYRNNGDGGGAKAVRITASSATGSVLRTWSLTECRVLRYEGNLAANNSLETLELVCRDMSLTGGTFAFLHESLKTGAALQSVSVTMGARTFSRTLPRAGGYRLLDGAEVFQLETSVTDEP